MEDRVIVKVEINIDIKEFKESVKLELEKFEGKNVNEVNIEEIAKIFIDGIRRNTIINTVK